VIRQLAKAIDMSTIKSSFESSRREGREKEKKTYQHKLNQHLYVNAMQLQQDKRQHMQDFLKIS
jgi:hypothetical protein